MTVPMLVALTVGCSQTDPKSDDTLDAVPVDGSVDMTDADADTDADSDTDTDTDTDTTTTVDTDTTTTTTTDTGTPPCLNTVEESFPVNLAVDVFPGTGVWFVLSYDDPTATITVNDDAGALVAGTTTVSGRLVSWEGAPFASLSTYSATLDWACGSTTISFTTSDVGAPLSVDPTGLVYQLDLSQGAWAEPVGLGALIESQLGTNELLASPTVVGGTSIEFMGAAGELGIQNLCSPTILLPSVDWNDPFMELSTPLLPVDIGGQVVDVHDVKITGAFTSDASRIQVGTVTGLLDTRYLGAALGLGTGYDAACLLVSTFGIACEPCPSDNQPYCLGVWVDNLDAPNIPGSLVERTIADIQADPTCP